MAADPPKPQVLVIAAYLDDVDLDLDAAKRLIAEPPNRLAAFHLQQAAEKLIKAVRLGHGLRVTAEHNLELLIGELPRDDPWRAKLVVLESLSSYATSYRYPSPSGRRKDAPGGNEVVAWLKTIGELNAEARAAFVSRA
jgi:HEPN domain-containing protein